MANPIDAHPDNAPGPWYVDAACIDCTLCRSIAPDCFSSVRPEEYGVVNHSVVAQQPETAEQIEACLDAMRNCPVRAIGRHMKPADGRRIDEPSVGAA